MQRLTILALVLIATGLFVAVDPPSAFDTNVSERDVGIETAPDESAFVGVVPDGQLTADGTLRLESANSDGGGLCFFVCTDFEYDARDLLTFEGNVPATLTVDQATVTASNGAITGGDGLRLANAPGVGTARGDFRCPAGGLFGGGNQQTRSATVTVDATLSGGDTTVELQRQVDVECVPD